MRAKELIPILSAVLEVPLETAWVVDRSLADNGLRTKGKGRTPPDMTRRDALNFMLACMTMNIATRAWEPTKHWGNCPEQDEFRFGDKVQLPEWFERKHRGVNLIDRMVNIVNSVEDGVFNYISFDFIISTSRNVAEFRYYDEPATEVRREHFFYMPGSSNRHGTGCPLPPKEFAHFETGIQRQVEVHRETFMAIAHYTEREE